MITLHFRVMRICGLANPFEYKSFQLMFLFWKIFYRSRKPFVKINSHVVTVYITSETVVLHVWTMWCRLFREINLQSRVVIITYGTAHHMFHFRLMKIGGLTNPHWIQKLPINVLVLKNSLSFPGTFCENWFSCCDSIYRIRNRGTTRVDDVMQSFQGNLFCSP